MHRLAIRAAAAPAGRMAASPANSRVGAMRFKTGIDNVAYDEDKAMGDAHESAKSDAAQHAPNTEGHSLDNMKRPRNEQDAHTEQLTKGHKQAEGTEGNQASSDAINLTHGETGGAAEKSRKKWSTSEGQKFQPGQGGEQIGSSGAGKQPKEGKVGQDSVPSAGTLSGVGDALKNMVGQGPASGKGFHTYAALRYPSSTPEEAVDKGARKPKDTGVGAEQTPHLPHHNAGEGDSMPAVKDNASLPSKKGSIDDKKKKPAKASGKGTNAHQGPSGEERPTGTSGTPGSRAVDPSTQTHSPSFSQDGPSATYTHVVGSPDPDSHKTKYQYADSANSEGAISGTASRSSTSTSTYYNALTKDLPKNEAGIGSSNHMIRDPLKGADEMMAKMDPNGTSNGGQQGADHAAARGEAKGQVGGRNQPPDVGQIPEDTLPKPINAQA